MSLAAVFLLSAVSAATPGTLTGQVGERCR